MADNYIIAGATIILADKLLEGGLVVVRDGRIDYIGEESLEGYLRIHPAGRSLDLIDGSSSFLAPRLVEMHMHGAFGIGFENISNGADLLSIASGLEARGVGCFVPTILWDEAAVSRLVAAIETSGLPENILPGIYIEGPFVNPEKRGGIGLDQITDPDPNLCRKIIATARGRLKVMALAPELPGIEALYPILEEAGVLVSLGHSGASAGVALPPPRFSVTHLFNAMSGLDHRGGGLVNIALAGIPSWTELNADGIHVNASCMKIASLCIPPERLILTSDAVISAGLPYGDFSYFGKSVASKADGVRYSESGTLIGSNRIGMEIVKSYTVSTGASLPAAIQSMSATPSTALRLAAADSGGIMQVGAKADVFLWDSSLSSCRRPGSTKHGSEKKLTL